MDPNLEALLIAVAGPVGVVVILLLSALLAAGLAEKINPTPEQPVEEQVRLAIEREEAERLQAEEMERVRGRESKRKGPSPWGGF